MFCKKCGSPLEDGARFCTRCGEKVELEPVAVAPDEAAAPAVVPDAPAETPAAEEPVAEAVEIAEAVVAEDADVTEAAPTELLSDAYEIAETVAAGDAEPEAAAPVPAAPARCAVCGTELSAGSLFCPACGAPAAQTAPKKRKLWPWLVGAAVIVAACVALAVCLLLPGRSPLEELADAFTGLAKTDGFRGHVSVSSDGLNQVDVAYEFLNDKENPAIVLDDGAGSTIAFYQGYQLYRIAGYGSFKQEMQGTAGQLFGSDTMDTLEVEEFDFEHFDIREFMAQVDPSGQTLESLEEGMDLDVLNECMRSLPKKFEDKNWLEQHLGYEITKEGSTRTYRLTIGVRLLQGLVEHLKPAFRDMADYETLMDELSWMDDTDFSISLTAVTEGKYPASLRFTAMVDGDSVGVEMTIEDIGNVTITAEQLDLWLDEAAG